MKALLLFPPLADPTCGYLSLSYLASFVRARSSHQVRIIDANIGALNSSARPARVQTLLARAAELRNSLDSQPKLTGEELRSLQDMVVGTTINAEDPGTAIRTLRNPSTFHDHPTYLQAVGTLLRWMRLLAVDGYAGQFRDLGLADNFGVNLSSLQSLTPDVVARIGGPFAHYYEAELLPAIREYQPSVLGINVTYHEQLPFALHICSLIRRVDPAIRLVLGGTDVSQCWKFSMESRGVRHLFRYADAIVVGEGESAFLAILDRCERGQPIDDIDGVVTAGKYESNQVVRPTYEDLDQLPSPDYSDLPWADYWSPEPFVYYAPTRGCYWDRCTFCDYGLSVGRPTSPWRQRSVDRVLKDLQGIARWARFVYFSVDVVAPNYLSRIASGLVANSIPVLWGAELRLERHYTSETCSMLRSSGCVAISVGFESGTQRVLDLMDKGTQVATACRVIRDFAAAGVCVQIMGFTGFPTETLDEALGSVRVLDDLGECWVFGGLGEFQLTAGSLIVRNPGHFGVGEVRTYEGDDVWWRLRYKVEQGLTDTQKAEVAQACGQLRHPLELRRPFVGGTDSSHSYMYMARYGRETRTRLDDTMRAADEERTLVFRGTLVRGLRHDICGAGCEPGTLHVVLEDGRIQACAPLTADIAQSSKGLTMDALRAKLEADRLPGAGLRRLHFEHLVDVGFFRGSSLPTRVHGEGGIASERADAGGDPTPTAEHLAGQRSDLGQMTEARLHVTRLHGK